MKKRALLLIAIFAVLMCIFAISASAADVTIDGVVYTTADNSNYDSYNGSATVKSATAEIVKIPDFITVDGGNKYVVDAIAEGAFRENKTVKEIYILSDYITKIPKNFVNNTLKGVLEKVFINFSNITSIGQSAFNQSHNPDYGMDAALTTFDFYDAAAFKADKSVVKITNPDLSKLTSLGNFAMQGVKFDRLELPATITSIPARVFQAARIDTIVVKGKLTSVGNAAFDVGAKPSAIYIDLSSVTTIGEYAFLFAKGYDSGNTTTQWYDLDGNKFVDLSSVTTFSQYAFSSSNLGSASTIAWPQNVSSVGFQCFRACNITGTVYFGADSTKNVTISEYALGGNPISTLILGEGVTKFSANNSSSSLKTIISLADTLNLASANIVSSGATIYAKATSGSSQSGVTIVKAPRVDITYAKRCGIVADVYDEASNITTFGVLNHTEGAGVPTTPSCTVPSGLEYRCSFCSALMRYEETAPAPGHTYDENSPLSVSALSCTTDEKKTFHCTTCGEDFEIVTAFATGHNHSEVSYPVESKDGTPGIKRFTCSNFNGTCGDYYEYAYKISPADLPVYITLKDGTKLTLTGNDVFEFEISVSNNVYSCRLISVKSEFTFDGKKYSTSTDVYSLSIPYGFTSVASSFSRYIAVLDFSTAGDVQFSNTFQDHTALKEIILGNGAKIGGSMFRGNTGLRIIRIADGASVVFPADTNIFLDFRSLEKFIIGNGANVRFERNKTFDVVNTPNCRLKAIEIGDGATVYFGNNTFNGEPELTTIKFGKNGNYTFEQNSFKNCTALENVIIPEGSTVTINGSAFEGCTALVNVFLPSSVKSVPASAFSGCNALSFVGLMGATSIGDNAFKASAEGEGALVIYSHATADMSISESAFAGRATKGITLYTMSQNAPSISVPCTLYKGIPHAQTPHTELETCLADGYIGYVTDCPCGVVYYDVDYTITNADGTTNASFDEKIILNDFDGHNFILSIKYENGFLTTGIKSSDCSRCSLKEFDDTVVPAIFTTIGFSAREKGTISGISVGFEVDISALNAYLSANKGTTTLTLSIFMVNPKNIDENGAFLTDGIINATKGSIQVNVTDIKYSFISCFVNGFDLNNEKHTSLELIIGAFIVKTENGVSTYEVVQKDYSDAKFTPVSKTYEFSDYTLYSVTVLTVINPTPVQQQEPVA